MATKQASNFADRRKRELKVFFVLAALLAPAVSVVSVGGYGFTVWMYQLVAGPPGSSSHASSNTNSHASN